MTTFIVLKPSPALYQRLRAAPQLRLCAQRRGRELPLRNVAVVDALSLPQNHIELEDVIVAEQATEPRGTYTAYAQAPRRLDGFIRLGGGMQRMEFRADFVLSFTSDEPIA